MWGGGNGRDKFITVAAKGSSSEHQNLLKSQLGALAPVHSSVVDLKADGKQAFGRFCTSCPASAKYPELQNHSPTVPHAGLAAALPAPGHLK